MNTRPIDETIQNAYKINRLILDVLTPTLQNWLKKKVSIYTKNVWIDIIYSNDRSLFSMKKIIVEYFDRYQKYPNDFKLFDITSCVAIARNILKIQPKHGWLQKYSDIKIDNFEEGDALNYARLIRNQFYGSKIEFKVETGEFNLFIEQLNNFFDKLGFRV